VKGGFDHRLPTHLFTLEISFFGICDYNVAKSQNGNAYIWRSGYMGAVYIKLDLLVQN